MMITQAQKTKGFEKLIEMATDGEHGDALSREEAIWLIKNHSEFTDQELGEMIGEKAVSAFRKVANAIK